MLNLLDRGVENPTRSSIRDGVRMVFHRRSSPFLILIAVGFFVMIVGFFWGGDDEEGLPNLDPLTPNAAKETGNSLYGTVKLNGTILSSGGTLILFGSESTRPLSAGIIQPDGSYMIENAPTGPVQICFSLEKGPEKNQPLSNSAGKIMLRKNRKLGLASEDPNVKTKEVVIKRTKKTPGTERLTAEERASRKERRAEAAIHWEWEQLAEAAARKYGRLGLPDAIKTYLLEGPNAFDVEMQASIAETK